MVRLLFILFLSVTSCSIAYEAVTEQRLFVNILNNKKMKTVKILKIEKIREEHYENVVYKFRVKCPSCRAVNFSPVQNLSDMVDIYCEVAKDRNIVPVVEAVKIDRVYFDKSLDEYRIVSRVMMYKGRYTFFTFIYTGEVLK